MIENSKKQTRLVAAVDWPANILDHKVSGPLTHTGRYSEGDTTQNVGSDKISRRLNFKP